VLFRGQRAIILNELTAFLFIKFRKLL